MKNYTITEQQIKELAKGNKKVEKMFPEVFETKLQTGKWYHYNGWLICFTGIKNDTYKFELLQGYGFDKEMKFRERGSFGSSPEYWVLATEEEVEKALIKEAERRGFKSGVYSNASNIGREYYKKSKLYGKFNLDLRENFTQLCIGNYVIFQNGKWAEIIKAKYLTKKQAEEELTKIKNDGYEYQIID